RADLARASAFDPGSRARGARRDRGRRDERAGTSDTRGDRRDSAAGAALARGLARRAHDHRARDETTAPEDLMKKTVGVLIMVGLAVSSAEARAQTTPDARTFFDINGGVQVLSPTLDAGGSFLLFGETGTVRTSQNVGVGILGDARLGHRVGRRLAVAIAVSG